MRIVLIGLFWNGTCGLTNTLSSASFSKFYGYVVKRLIPSTVLGEYWKYGE